MGGNPTCAQPIDGSLQHQMLTERSRQTLWHLKLFRNYQNFHSRQPSFSDRQTNTRTNFFLQHSTPHVHENQAWNVDW